MNSFDRRYKHTKRAHERAKISHRHNCAIGKSGICTCGLLGDLADQGVHAENIYPGYTGEMANQKRLLRRLNRD